MTDDRYSAGGVWFTQCDRTDAHGEHRILAEDGRPHGNTWCRGIKAHPDTMIGGANR